MPRGVRQAPPSTGAVATPPDPADLIEQAQAQAGSYKGNPKNTEAGKKDRIPDVPWDMNASDENAEEAMVASMQGRGPRVVDLTPQRPPEVPPSSLSEMWMRFTEFRTRVENYIAAGGVQVKAGHPTATLFRCAAHSRPAKGEDPGVPGIVEIMWPAGPEGAKCPVCNDLTLLIPLSPEEIADYQANGNGNGKATTA